MALSQSEQESMYQVYKDGVRNIEGVPVRYESYLGLPSVDGHILMSDMRGHRVWTAPTGPGIGIPYPGPGIPISKGLLLGWDTSITPAAGLLRYSGGTYSWDSTAYLSALPAHAHGQLSNVGAIGVTTGKPIITTTDGVLSAGSFGTTAGTFCEGNDSRFSGIGAIPTLITVANETSDTENFVSFFTAATGNLGPKTNANFKFNAATGELTVSSIHATGNIYADGEVAAFTGADPGSDFWNSVPHATHTTYGTIILDALGDVTKFLNGDGGWTTMSSGTFVHSELSNLSYATAGHTGFAPIDSPVFTGSPTSPRLNVRSTTASHGFAYLEEGGAAHSGYLSWYKAAVTPLRLGYIGYDNTNVGLTLENSANFNISGGKVGIGIAASTYTTEIYTDQSAAFTTAYGLKISAITTTAGAGKTYGLWIDAHGSDDGNYGLIVENGYAGFGTTAPDERAHVVGNLHVTGNIYADGEVSAFTGTPPSSDYWLNVPHASTTVFGTVKIGSGLHIDGSGFLVADAGSVGVTDGDKGDIVVSSSGATWMIDSGVRTNWDTAYTDRMKWDGGATGLTASTGRSSLGLGSAATANLGTGASDAAYGNHNHSGVYEPAFSKNTGFNLALGTTAGTVLEGRTFGTGANATIADYATLASPTFTGTPSVPKLYMLLTDSGVHGTDLPGTYNAGTVYLHDIYATNEHLWPETYGTLLTVMGRSSHTGLQIFQTGSYTADLRVRSTWYNQSSGWGAWRTVAFLDNPTFTGTLTVPNLDIRTTTATDGSVRITAGTSSQAGYIGWYKSGSNNRLGYIGYDNTNLGITLEQGYFFINSGNVCIGTTVSTGKFNIAASAYHTPAILLTGQEYYADTYTTTGGIEINLGVNRTLNKQLWIKSSDSAIDGSSKQIRIQPASGIIDVVSTSGDVTLDMNLQSNGGNIGIGTATVNGAATNRKVVDINGTSSSMLMLSVSGTGRGFIYANATDVIIGTNGTNANGISFESGTSGTKMQLTAAGALQVVGEVTAFYSSDSRLKSDIKPFTALDIVDKLSPKTFKWNEVAKKLNATKDDRNNFGLIAQEVKKVLPELIHTIYEKYEAVDYVMIIPILLQAIKELKQEINEIRNDSASNN